MRKPTPPDRLTDLGERIRAAKEARKPKSGRLSEEAKMSSLAWRMVTELVGGLVVGGAIGYGLDSLFGTLPVFLLIFGVFGFAAGINLVLRAAAEMREKQAAGGDPPRDETE